MWKCFGAIEIIIASSLQVESSGGQNNETRITRRLRPRTFVTRLHRTKPYSYHNTKSAHVAACSVSLSLRDTKTSSSPIISWRRSDDEIAVSGEMQQRTKKQTSLANASLQLDAGRHATKQFSRTFIVIRLQNTSRLVQS